MPENTLTIEQVLGTTLKETTDALVPLTKRIIRWCLEDTEEAAEEEAPVEEAPTQLLLYCPVAPARQWADKTIKIHIAEGRGIDLEVPMAIAGQMGVAQQPQCLQLQQKDSSAVEAPAAEASTAPRSQK